MTEEITVRATVVVALEIRVGDSWPPNVTMDQVHKQATESACGMVGRAFEGNPAVRILRCDPTSVAATKASR